MHGSRTLGDERVKILILEEISRYGCSALVTHAEPDGACRVTRELARELAIPLHLHFLNFAKRRGAWEHRCHAVLADSDRCLFVWDGKSKGCSNELKIAVKRGLPYNLHTLEPARGPSQSFEQDSDWGAILE